MGGQYALCQRKCPTAAITPGLLLPSEGQVRGGAMRGIIGVPMALHGVTTVTQVPERMHVEAMQEDAIEFVQTSHVYFNFQVGARLYGRRTLCLRRWFPSHSCN